jgi:ubiquinol-cytochrome c reductase iron-sulfur subunit
MTSAEVQPGRAPTEPESAPPSLAEPFVTVSFLVSAAAGIGLAVLYWRGGQPQLEGGLLALAFTGLAVGFIVWANRLLPQGPSVQEREHMETTAAQRGAFERDLERGGVVTRRRMILRSLGLALTALGVAALFPIRSFGPRPGNKLAHTLWRNGLRLVTLDGKPVFASDVPLGGLVTVFPEGSPGDASGQAVLMRVEPGLIRPVKGRETWTPEGLIAYSKICTHAGCPVGLYQAQAHELLCPCHQSNFDVLNGARPLFGPAAAALPQLPLSLDSDGVIRATGDFSDPVGPYFWHTVHGTSLD